MSPLDLAFEAYQRYHLAHTDPNAPGGICRDKWDKYMELCMDLSPHDRDVLSGIVQMWWYARMGIIAPNPTPFSPGEDP